MLRESEAKSLNGVGYCLVRETELGDLIRISEMLGTPRPSRPNGSVIDILTPKEETDSRPGTISSHCGLGQFPWHSDGAVDPDPPRYVLMRAENVNSESAATEILDLRDLLDGNFFQSYRRLVCEVATRRSSYLSPFVTRRNETWCAKWDPLRMRALGAKSARFKNAIEEASPTHQHRWKIGDLLIIDNWRCLHRRSEASPDSLRVIQRIVVKDRSN